MDPATTPDVLLIRWVLDPATEILTYNKAKAAHPKARSIEALANRMMSSWMAE